MAKGISPKLPLTTNEEDGKYTSNKTLKEVVAQNLKHLILTIPGERIMDPDFGAGLSTFLFRQNDPLVHEELKSTIYTQTEKYLPFVEITDIEILSYLDDPNNISVNALHVSIEYHVIPLGIDDILDLNIE
jgi:phage baseplate assembly protein W